MACARETQATFWWLSILAATFLLPAAFAQQNSTVDSATWTLASNGTSSCDCGFLDPTTNRIYSDSIILYFNETNTTVPSDVFSVDTFTHPYEKGYSIFYREGATTENVFFSQGNAWNFAPSWLSMNVSAFSPEHLVNGAQLQSVRQDMLYGSFRVFMRSPQPYAGGSSLSMMLRYNETSAAELDLLNQDNSQDNACMMAVVGDGRPDPSNGINYTTLGTEDYNIGAWDFWEWRMDWNADTVDWYAGANKTMTNSTANATLVDQPVAFYLKHWSNGDQYHTQGPPQNNSEAAIGWVRLFFNSSVQSTSKINDQSCSAVQLCSTDDWTLRITTSYGDESEHKWEPIVDSGDDTASSIGQILLAASGCFSLALIIHALLAKTRRKRISNPSSPAPVDPKDVPAKAGPQISVVPAGYEMDDITPTSPGSMSERRLLEPNSRHVSINGSIIEAYMRDPDDPLDDYSAGTQDPTSRYLHPIQQFEGSVRKSPPDLSPPSENVVVEGSAAPMANPGAKLLPASGALPQARGRVDYLAGLVAVCSLLVSCSHFLLTFVPGVVMEYLPQHYQSEYWARRTIEPFFFNEVWVGLFFTTSTRFLTSGYLRTGNLQTIAEKIVCRCPRLMIPITAVILFEYFLIDLGAVKYLEYIPSITWSTWPSIGLYPNFGWFFDETLQMLYLIPNAAPQVTLHFCTGVLWTIPVQLQNSWLVLLGVVIIREIRTPWKRFGYYTFCIVNHWYALSWGSYFWLGLFLADLDVTYKYRKWIQARAHVHYPMLIAAILLVWLSLANDLFSVWTGYTFSTNERGIHPEPRSSKPIAQTSLAGYPAYIEPKLNGLLFAIGSQYIVELSSWLQAALSTPVFLCLFPHVFTIYLIHGLIFWSIGTFVCVYFASLYMAYWLNMLLTAIICYVTLFLCLPIITPAMEMMGKEMTKTIWISASEEPAPWRPSSFPLSIEEIRDMVRRKDDESTET